MINFFVEQACFFIEKACQQGCLPFHGPRLRLGP